MRSFCKESVIVEESLSVNRLAWKLLERLVENPAFYGVKIRKTEAGTTIVDAGIEATGGFEAEDS